MSESFESVRLPIVSRSVERTEDYQHFEQVAIGLSLMPKENDIRLELIHRKSVASLKHLGQTAVSEIIEGIKENLPESFDDELEASVVNAQVFSGQKNRQTVKRLALGIKNPQLLEEREAMLNVFKEVVGNLPREFYKFRWQVICGDVDRYSVIDMRKLQNQAPKKVILKPGQLTYLPRVSL